MTRKRVEIKSVGYSIPFYDFILSENFKKFTETKLFLKKTSERTVSIVSVALQCVRLLHSERVTNNGYDIVYWNSIYTLLLFLKEFLYENDDVDQKRLVLERCVDKKMKNYLESLGLMSEFDLGCMNPLHPKFDEEFRFHRFFPNKNPNDVVPAYEKKKVPKFAELYQYQQEKLKSAYQTILEKIKDHSSKTLRSAPISKTLTRKTAFAHGLVHEICGDLCLNGYCGFYLKDKGAPTPEFSGGVTLEKYELLEELFSCSEWNFCQDSYQKQRMALVEDLLMAPTPKDMNGIFSDFWFGKGETEKFSFCVCNNNNKSSFEEEKEKKKRSNGGLLIDSDRFSVFFDCFELQEILEMGLNRGIDIWGLEEIKLVTDRLQVHILASDDIKSQKKEKVFAYELLNSRGGFVDNDTSDDDDDDDETKKEKKEKKEKEHEKKKKETVLSHNIDFLVHPVRLSSRVCRDRHPFKSSFKSRKRSPRSLWLGIHATTFLFRKR